MPGTRKKVTALSRRLSPSRSWSWMLAVLSPAMMVTSSTRVLNSVSSPVRTARMAALSCS